MIGEFLTVNELLKDLHLIKLAYNKNGTPRLLNVIVTSPLWDFRFRVRVVELLFGTRLVKVVAKYKIGVPIKQVIQRFLDLYFNYFG